MTQVSGSISLEMSKVVRETVSAVIAELTRQTPNDAETEHGYPTPLEWVAMTVSATVGNGLANKLNEIQAKVDRLEEMIRAEAERQDRLTVRGTDGQELYSLPQTEVTEPLAGAAHLDYAEDRAAANRRADDRLAEANQNGSDDSWYEEVE